MAFQISHNSEACWYALYTRARNEKKVFLLLEKSGIEAYLPLRKTLKQWSDRKKWVEEPLLRSYVFVKISEKEYYQVLQIMGVVRFVTFSGKAAIIPEWQIESLRILLSSDCDLKLSNGHLKPGDPVEVITGALAGFRGEVFDVKGNKKIILRISHLGLNLEVSVLPGALRVLQTNPV